MRVSSKVKYVCGWLIERSQMPRAARMAARQKACAIIRPRGWPAAMRAASEKGKATPTRNENDGWMRSWSEP